MPPCTWSARFSLTWRVAGNAGEDLEPFFTCFFPSGRWFDVLQKVSTQLKTNLTSATKNRADKVSGKWQVPMLEAQIKPSTCQVGCLKFSVEG